MRNKWVILALIVAGTVWLLRQPSAVDIHDRIQQRLLEAELGSSTNFYFAGVPRLPVPDGEPTDQLLSRLKSPAPENRWQAAEQLTVRHDPRIVTAIIRAMRDPKGTVRVCVMASALGHLKDPRALSALTEASLDPVNRDLRLCAVQSLGMLGDRRAIPALIKVLQAGKTPVAAANAIARMGDERGVKPLIEAAAHPGLRLWMVMALGELGSPSALRWLGSLSADPQPAVRRAAREAAWKIAHLSMPDPVHTLAGILQKEASVEHRMWAAFRLGELGQPAAIPALVTALTDHEASVRSRAAAALIRTGAAAVPVITQSAHNARGQLQHYAAAILGYIGKPPDIPVLQSIVNKSADKIVVAIAGRSIDLIKRFSQPDRGFVELGN